MADFGIWRFFDSLFPVMFVIIFAVVIGTFVMTGVRGLQQWRRNEASPRLTVPAVVVTKRTNSSYHRHANHGGGYSTSYYATFEVESGDRIELAVSGAEFGQLAEGDRGMLSFQGTRYQGFVRDGQPSS